MLRMKLGWLQKSRIPCLFKSGLDSAEETGMREVDDHKDSAVRGSMTWSVQRQASWNYHGIYSGI